MQNEQLKPGHHTILSPAQVERYGLVSEELGEGTQAVGKIFRHGFGAVDPMGNYYDNKTQLEKELGDVVAATLLSASAGELSLGNIVGHAVNKACKIVDGEAFLHHQPQELLDKVAVAIGGLSLLHKELRIREVVRARDPRVATARTFRKMYSEQVAGAQKGNAADSTRRSVMLVSTNHDVSPAELQDLVRRFQTAEVDPLGNWAAAREALQASGDHSAAEAHDRKAADVKAATMNEIKVVVASCIKDCDFAFPVRSGTKRFQMLIDMLRKEYGEHCVFDFPRRRDFHRAIDLQNWAVHCLVQNSLDIGGTAA